jgi:hypothetical protein
MAGDNQGMYGGETVFQPSPIIVVIVKNYPIWTPPFWEIYKTLMSLRTGKRLMPEK